MYAHAVLYIGQRYFNRPHPEYSSSGKQILSGYPNLIQANITDRYRTDGSGGGYCRVDRGPSGDLRRAAEFRVYGNPFRVTAGSKTPGNHFRNIPPHAFRLHYVHSGAYPYISEDEVKPVAGEYSGLTDNNSVQFVSLEAGESQIAASGSLNFNSLLDAISPIRLPRIKRLYVDCAVDLNNLRRFNRSSTLETIRISAAYPAAQCIPFFEIMANDGQLPKIAFLTMRLDLDAFDSSTAPPPSPDFLTALSVAIPTLASIDLSLESSIELVENPVTGSVQAAFQTYIADAFGPVWQMGSDIADDEDVDIDTPKYRVYFWKAPASEMA